MSISSVNDRDNCALIYKLSESIVNFFNKISKNKSDLSNPLQFKCGDHSVIVIGVIMAFVRNATYCVWTSRN